MQDIWDSILSATYHQVQWLDHWYDILYIMKGLYNFGRMYMKKSHIIAWSLNTKCVITHMLDSTVCDDYKLNTATDENPVILLYLKTTLYMKLFSIIVK